MNTRRNPRYNEEYYETYYETPRQPRSHAGLIVGAAVVLALGGVSGTVFGMMAAKSGFTPRPVHTQLVHYVETDGEGESEQYSLIGETAALHSALASLGLDHADEYTINLIEGGGASYYDVTIYEGEDVYNVQVTAYTGEALTA